MSTFLIVSDFNIPSGYQTITGSIADRFVEQGHSVYVIGNGYAGEEHSYKFSLIPTQLSWIPQQTALLAGELSADWILFIMDLEKSNVINANIMQHRPDFHSKYKVGAIFPVESDPLCSKWKEDSKKFYSLQATFTRFGEKILRDGGLSCIVLPVGLDTFWYQEDNTPRTIMNKYILFVADNQLRKNIPGGFLMFKKFLETKPDYRLILLTRPGNPGGWMLEDLTIQMDIRDSVSIVSNQTVTRDFLKNLYRYADALLLPSLAEGIGLPIYEAQSQGCPVVATDCCAITEAVTDIDLLIPTDYTTIFNWGNVHHYWPSIEKGAELLIKATESEYKRTQAVYGSWNAAADKLDYYFKEFTRLEKVIDDAKEA